MKQSRAQAARLEQRVAALSEQIDTDRQRHDKALAASARQVEKTERQLDQIRASTSFRVGHRVVRTAQAPVRVVRSVVDLPKRVARALRWRAARLAKQNRVAGAIARRLPPEVRARLAPPARPRSSAPTSGGGGGSTASARTWPSVRTGLRAVTANGVDPAWSAVMDTHPVDEVVADDPTHIDLVLTTGDSLGREVTELATAHDAAVIDVSSRLAPLRPGLLPLGFSRTCRPEFLAVMTGGGGGAIAGPPGRTVDTISAADLPDPATEPDRFRETVQDYLALVDDATLHTDVARRARLLVDVAACGLPVAVTDADALAGHLPDAVLAEFASTEARDLTNPLEREMASMRQRRVVHHEASVRAVLDDVLVGAGRRGLRPPSISVTVASNRSSMIDNWAQLLAVQEYPDFEVIACLHGDAFTDDDEGRAREVLGDRVTICRIPAEHTLGDALNTAAERAGGELLVKWDDDDLYDTHHLADLVRAREYSGATLVGKAAEFAYLAGLDVTVRRLKSSTEQYSPTICGATLSISRSDLRDLGGWRRSRRRVDSLLIEDVRAAGGTTYRTSGFGFVMLRAAGDGHGHTWTAGDEYFLRGAVDQRRGLDVGFAGIEAPAEVLSRWSA